MTTERGPYARIAVLRSHDGDTVEFEADIWAAAPFITTTASASRESVER
jgi:hypothetical protein